MPVALSTTKLTEEEMVRWEEQFEYWRTHLDVAIEEIFKPVRLTKIQKVISRAIGNNEDIKIVCSRGFGKTWDCAMCAAAIAVLYPGCQQIVTSNTAKQATLLLGKLKILADQNKNFAHEVAPTNSRNYVSMSADRAIVRFKNGSWIESMALESARGSRAKVLWQDESLEVDQDTYDAIAEPIKNARRDISMTYQFKDFASKTVCLTSACEKSNSFYDKFMYTTKQMAKGIPGYFACAFDYHAAVENGITDEEFFIKEKERLPQITFDMEYGTIFVGGVSDTAFPFDLISKNRVLKNVELEQPKSSKSRYIISLDIATSEAKNADNSIISVIKFIEKIDGSFTKKLVFMQSFHGKTLDIISEAIRKLYHLKFPNCEKIIYDARGLGDSLDRFFDKEWYDETGREYPPLVTDEEQSLNPDAISILHPFRAVQVLNQRLYTNMRVSLEKERLELPISYREIQQIDIELPENQKLTKEEKAIFLEVDALQMEMNNIVAKPSGAGHVLYDVPKANMHKDRYSSLAMGLDWICEMEKINIKNNSRGKECIGIASEF